MAENWKLSESVAKNDFHQKDENSTMPFFAKSGLSKMASIRWKKQNKKTNPTFLVQLFELYNFAFGSEKVL